MPQPFTIPILRRQAGRLSKDEKSFFWPAARPKPSPATTIPVTKHDPSPVKSPKRYDANCVLRYDDKKVRNSYVLQFHRNTVAFAKDEAVNLIEVRENRLVVERENGEQWAFDPRRVHDFDVGQARGIAVAPGDRLLLRGNLKSAAIKNGDIVEVTSFNSNGSIQLKDGRCMPRSFRQFTHGYATTSHASQGSTVDCGILIIGEAGIRAANLQQAYVSNSRFRQWQTIYTTNAKAAKNAMANDTDRKLANELRERRIRQWRNIEALVADGETWRTIRNRVVESRLGRRNVINQEGIRHAA